MLILHEEKIAFIQISEQDCERSFRGSDIFKTLFRSKSIQDTNITNSSEFTCWLRGETTPVRLNAHPFFIFDQPLGRIHVHLEDIKSHEVKWD